MATSTEDARTHQKYSKIKMEMEEEEERKLISSRGIKRDQGRVLGNSKAFWSQLQRRRFLVLKARKKKLLQKKGKGIVQGWKTLSHGKRKNSEGNNSASVRDSISPCKMPICARGVHKGNILMEEKPGLKRRCSKRDLQPECGVRRKKEMNALTIAEGWSSSTTPMLENITIRGGGGVEKGERKEFSLPRLTRGM